MRLICAGALRRRSPIRMLSVYVVPSTDVTARLFVVVEPSGTFIHWPPSGRSPCTLLPVVPSRSLLFGSRTPAPIESDQLFPRFAEPASEGSVCAGEPVPASKESKNRTAAL